MPKPLFSAIDPTTKLLAPSTMSALHQVFDGVGYSSDNATFTGLALTTAFQDVGGASVVLPTRPQAQFYRLFSQTGVLNNAAVQHAVYAQFAASSGGVLSASYSGAHDIVANNRPDCVTLIGGVTVPANTSVTVKLQLKADGSGSISLGPSNGLFVAS